MRARQDFWQGFAVAPQTRRFADELLDGVLERREEIDRIIGEHSDRWRLDRLSKVDLNVIRLAVHEMSRTPPLPVEIAINEAVEIARRFGTGESSRFVNGLLDQIAGRLGLKRASPPPAAGRKHEDTTTRRHEEKDL